MIHSPKPTSFQSARIGAVAFLALPLAIAACSKPAPPPPAPMMSLSEEACAARAATTTGLDVSTVTIMPTSSTKTGDTVYAVTAGAATYTCVASPDGTISSFAAQ